ncbi:hypothetical protein BJX68DRAFT_47665 [Aspergillus pseudodeflectus]|uniref:Uncharacterized protein n=1 Tax=Aspergillus pseudodeflectus TaxID=176178 RepID=A0ABR4J8L1_9EURO
MCSQTPANSHIVRKGGCGSLNRRDPLESCLENEMTLWHLTSSSSLQSKHKRKRTTTARVTSPANRHRHQRQAPGPVLTRNSTKTEDARRYCSPAHHRPISCLLCLA